MENNINDFAEIYKLCEGKLNIAQLSGFLDSAINTCGFKKPGNLLVSYIETLFNTISELNVDEINDKLKNNMVKLLNILYNHGIKINNGPLNKMHHKGLKLNEDELIIFQSICQDKNRPITINKLNYLHLLQDIKSATYIFKHKSKFIKNLKEINKKYDIFEPLSKNIVNLKMLKVLKEIDYKFNYDHMIKIYSTMLRAKHNDEYVEIMNFFRDMNINLKLNDMLQLYCSYITKPIYNTRDYYIYKKNIDMPHEYGYGILQLLNTEYISKQFEKFKANNEKNSNKIKLILLTIDSLDLYNKNICYPAQIVKKIIELIGMNSTIYKYLLLFGYNNIIDEYLEKKFNFFEICDSDYAFKYACFNAHEKLMQYYLDNKYIPKIEHAYYVMLSHEYYYFPVIYDSKKQTKYEASASRIFKSFLYPSEVKVKLIILLLNYGMPQGNKLFDILMIDQTVCQKIHINSVAKDHIEEVRDQYEYLIKTMNASSNFYNKYKFNFNNHKNINKDKSINKNIYDRAFITFCDVVMLNKQDFNEILLSDFMYEPNVEIKPEVRTLEYLIDFFDVKPTYKTINMFSAASVEWLLINRFFPNYFEKSKQCQDYIANKFKTKQNALEYNKISKKKSELSDTDDSDDSEFNNYDYDWNEEGKPDKLKKK